MHENVLHVHIVTSKKSGIQRSFFHVYKKCACKQFKSKMVMKESEIPKNIHHEHLSKYNGDINKTPSPI